MKHPGISVGDVGSPTVEVLPVSRFLTARLSSVERLARVAERLLVVSSSLVEFSSSASITSGSGRSNRFEGTAVVVDRDTPSAFEQCKAVMKRHISFAGHQIIRTCTTSTSSFTYMKQSESLVVGGCCPGGALGVVVHRRVGGRSHSHRPRCAPQTPAPARREVW